MKLSNRKLRFLVSLSLLICGVLALYPYLAARPQRQLRKSVAGLERDLATSVLNTLSLGQSLAAKANELAAENAAFRSLADSLNTEAQSLKSELLALPERSSALSEKANTAFKALNSRITAMLRNAAESEK